MRKSRVVRPDTDVLEISNGDTLTVRRLLNHGEQTAAYQRMYIAGVDGQLRANVLQTGMALVTAYLLDWTLVDLDGKPIPIAGKPIEDIESALNAIDHQSFLEIKEAIEQHERKVLKGRAAGKLHDGGPTSPGTSPSPDAAAGDTTTSSP
jgi:hypothetical protein